MKFNKKGQGLSLETIIVAIIVLFVLVVLLLIFTGRLNIFAGQTGECSNNGGECLSACETPSEKRTALSQYDSACRVAYEKDPVNIKGTSCCSGVSTPK